MYAYVYMHIHTSIYTYIYIYIYIYIIYIHMNAKVSEWRKHQSVSGGFDGGHWRLPKKASLTSKQGPSLCSLCRDNEQCPLGIRFSSSGH